MTVYRSVLVHASDLAKHSRGLQSGAPFSVLIHGADEPDGDPLQVAQGHHLGDGPPGGENRRGVSRTSGMPTSIASRPRSAPSCSAISISTDSSFERGRLVAGFARAVNLRPESFAELSSS